MRIRVALFTAAGLALAASIGVSADDRPGQTPPLIWRAKTKSIDRIVGHGPALGMMDDYVYTEGPQLTLANGDVLLAFTDGFVEARSVRDADRMFEETGMRSILEQCATTGCSARELTEALVREALEFSGGKRVDDMTVVAVRRTTDSRETVRE